MYEVSYVDDCERVVHTKCKLFHNFLCDRVNSTRCTKERFKRTFAKIARNFTIA